MRTPLGSARRRQGRRPKRLPGSGTWSSSLVSLLCVDCAWFLCRCGLSVAFTDEAKLGFGIIFFIG
jgi:hypothetical protein